MAAAAAVGAEPEAPEVEHEVVDDDERGVRLDLEDMQRAGVGGPADVHEGHRLEQPDAGQPLGDGGGDEPLDEVAALEARAPPGGQPVHHVEPDVVARAVVLGARVAQADEEA